jgi:hypothetical protein
VTVLKFVLFNYVCRVGEKGLMRGLRFFQLLVYLLQDRVGAGVALV